MEKSRMTNAEYAVLVKELESVRGLSVSSLITVAVPHNYCL